MDRTELTNGIMLYDKLNKEGYMQMTKGKILATADFSERYPIGNDSAGVIYWEKPTGSEEDREFFKGLCDRLNEVTHADFSDEHLQNYLDGRGLEKKLDDYKINIRFNHETEWKTPSELEKISDAKGKLAGAFTQLGIMSLLGIGNAMVGGDAYDYAKYIGGYCFLEIASAFVIKRLTEKWIPFTFSIGYLLRRYMFENTSIKTSYLLDKYLKANTSEKPKYWAALRKSVAPRQEQEGFSLAFVTPRPEEIPSLFEYLLFGKGNAPKIAKQNVPVLRRPSNPKSFDEWLEERKKEEMKKKDEEKQEEVEEVDDAPKITNPWDVNIPKHEGEEK